MQIASSTPVAHKIVSRDEWLQERLAVLEEERKLTQQHDALAARIRRMPWVKVEKSYTFDSPRGRKTLGDLFGPHHQLIVYHFMFDPKWSQGCKSCSFIADHYDGLVVHLAHRDISFMTVSKAPIEKIEQFRSRMGWSFPWVSAAGNEFNRDFGVSFTDEELADPASVYNFNRRPYPIRELPGLSVFTRGEGASRDEIYHTYSTFARGLDHFMMAYRFMDVTPKGRDEQQGGGMEWLRHHDRYEDANFVDPWAERPGITGPVPN